MQGISAHLEFLPTDNKRRYPSKCIYVEGNVEVTYVNVPKAVIIKQNVVPKNVNIITKKLNYIERNPPK